MARALRELDTATTVHSTDYFNHSFVPDFQLSWDDKAIPDRDVYLRLDNSAEFVQADIELMGENRPIFIGLSPLEERDAIVLGEADEGRQSRTLVTDPLAVEDLAPVDGAAFARVLPSAFLKGGRGVVREPEAEQLERSAQSLFDGARRHSPGEITSSSSTLATHLQETQHSSLMNLGRVVWEATGGDPARFPAQTPLTGVTDEGLAFLLQDGPEDDTSFWRSVGRYLNVERLLRVTHGQPPNLQIAVNANLDRLLVRHLAVRPEQSSFDHTAGTRWLVSQNALQLRGSDFRALLSTHSDNTLSNSVRGSALSISEFEERVQDLLVESLSLTTSGGKHDNNRV